MKIIGIVGSRRRDTESDFRKCEEVFLSIYEEGDEIVSGGCPQGGDRFAEIIAKKHQIPIKIYYANWNKYGKLAGFRRNGNIAEDAHVLIAIVAGDRTGGTEDTIRKAEHKERKVIIVPPINDSDPLEFPV